MAAANSLCFNLEFAPGPTHLAWVGSARDRCTKQIYTAAKFEGKI